MKREFIHFLYLKKQSLYLKRLEWRHGPIKSETSEVTSWNLKITRLIILKMFMELGSAFMYLIEICILEYLSWYLMI
jgi:hypothetical protein